MGKPDVEKMEENKDVKGLIKALKDKDETVRGKAANALGELKDRKAVKQLIKALQDDSSEVQCASAEALGKIGDKKAVGPLILKLGSLYAGVQVSASRALVKIGEPSVKPLLLAMREKDMTYIQKEMERTLYKLKTVWELAELDKEL